MSLALGGRGAKIAVADFQFSRFEGQSVQADTKAMVSGRALSNGDGGVFPEGGGTGDSLARGHEIPVNADAVLDEPLASHTTYTAELPQAALHCDCDRGWAFFQHGGSHHLCEVAATRT